MAGRVEAVQYVLVQSIQSAEDAQKTKDCNLCDSLKISLPGTSKDSQRHTIIFFSIIYLIRKFKNYKII